MNPKKKLILDFRLVLESEDRRTERRKMEFSGAGGFYCFVPISVF